MVLAVEKGLVFTKYWCFRKLVRRYSSTFLIMLSPTMNSFRFLGVNWILRWWWWLFLSLSGGWFSLFIIWLTSFISEDVTPVLVKWVVSSGSALWQLPHNFENWKSHLFVLFVTSKTQSVSSVSDKLTTLGFFFVQNKDWTKAEIG